MQVRMMIAILAAAGATACSDRIATPAGGPAGAAAAPVGAAADTVDGANLRVRLDALAAPRPQRAGVGRNPFRFADAVGVDAPAVEEPAEGAATVAPPGGETVHAGLQPAPAGGGAVRRGLRFIAVVDAPQSAGFIAVLSDGETVFQGRVGDTIDGRYRIMSIGTDMAELVFLPTGERQVLYRDGA